MNLSVSAGIFLAISVIWFGVLAHNGRMDIFLDSHALILVIGGTLAAALIAFPIRQIREVFGFVVNGVLMPSPKRHLRAIEDVMRLSSRPELADIDAVLRESMHPFLIEGYALLKRHDLTDQELKTILHGRSLRFKERYGMDAKVLASLAKFPPAFGLLGATTGMIAMMSNLGTGGKEAIGPSMAVALVATFWGIGLANLILLPLADHAMRLNHEDARLRQIIATGLVLIHKRARPILIYEYLVGFLPMNERSHPRLRHAIQVAEQEGRHKAPAAAS